MSLKPLGRTNASTAVVLTGEVGVDVVFDPVRLVHKSLKIVRQKSWILVVGYAGTEGNLKKKCYEQDPA